MRIENSPEYEANMERARKERVKKEEQNLRHIAKAKEMWRNQNGGWLPMEECPFAALDDAYGYDATICVTNGECVALCTVAQRFGTPIFWKTPPQQIMRDGVIVFEGGEASPRDDLPDWWWDWELTDEHGMMAYAGGHEVGKEEINFVPVMWSFLPEPKETPTNV